jgi:hypothetical protein
MILPKPQAGKGTPDCLIKVKQADLARPRICDK